MVDVTKLKFRHSKRKTRSKGFEINSIKNILDPSRKSVLTKPVQVEFYNMILITKGFGILEIDFKEYSVKEGDVVFISQNRVHKFVDYENLEGALTMFTENFLYEFLGSHTMEVLDLFRQTYVNPVLNIFKKNNLIVTGQLKLIKDIYSEDNEYFDFQVFTLAFRTLISIVRKRSLTIDILKEKNNTVFIKFSNLIDSNYKELKTVESYAKLMNVSKKTINIKTYKSVDMSAKQYIIYKVIQKIKIHLCFEEKNIDQISQEMGFTEAYNMTKFFKKYTGLTPTAFKKLNKTTN